jgi:hypothetical protein
LAVWARDGSGPVYEISSPGGIAIYKKRELDLWAEERLQRPERRGRPPTETPGPRTLARRAAKGAGGVWAAA